MAQARISCSIRLWFSVCISAFRPQIKTKWGKDSKKTFNKNGIFFSWKTIVEVYKLVIRVF